MQSSSELASSSRSSVDLGSVSTTVEAPNPTDPWDNALRKALRRLPTKDAQWLADAQHRKSFTSTEIVDVIRRYERQHTTHPVQRFLARIDPIVSHIRSFAAAISAITNANPVGAGIVWGSIYLVLIVAGRTQDTLAKVLNFLSNLSPQLALFSRWHGLFPHRSFTEVGDAIENAYSEIIGFCTTAVRHLRRHPLGNLVRTMFNNSLETELRKHETKLRTYTTRVRDEVDFAHKKYVQTKLAAIETVFDAAPTPRYMELPIIRIIPHSRNDRFFGRQDILEYISKKLLSPTMVYGSSYSRKQQKVAMCGPGGSGKTQIALEYTYRHLDDYKVVIWILADNPDKISQGFGDAASMLGMPKGTQSASETRSFVLQRLSATNEPYLLCFDNVDDFSLIAGCFPRDNTGSILITSRDSVRTGDLIGEVISVNEFSIQEGCNFLSSLLHKVDETNPNDRAVLKDISTAFHGYPLALAQVAAFIRNGGCALPDFLGLFQNTKLSNAIASIPIDDYHATLSTVWDLSFQSLSERSRQILEILVYYDPDSVPYVLLEKGCIYQDDNDGIATELDYMANPLDLWDALKGLKSQSLIRTNPELKTISIHRFLQDQAFQRLCADPSRRHIAFERSLFLLSNFQPRFPNVTQHWSPDLFDKSELCLPHIHRLAKRFLESPQVFRGLENKLGGLMFECASYQFERFHHQAATDTFAIARELIGRAAAPNELILSDCYRMEGRMFNESGQANRAAESNRKAHEYALRAISKDYIGENDQRMPRILTGLGNSLSQLGDFERALECQLEAKRLCGDVPPDQSDAITIIQLNLGFLLYRRGEMRSAEGILRATLEASPRTPAAMYALGNTLLSKGCIEEAIAVHLNGLQIYIEMFGDQHALVGRCAYKVGEILLLHKADPTTARRYIRKALKIYSMQESPYYTLKANARATRMLAKAFEMEGRLEEATPLFGKAWTLRKEIDGIYGSRHDNDMDYTSVMFYWDQ